MLANALHGLIGVAGLCAIAWVLGENRRCARWTTAVVGVAIQVALAAAVLYLPPVAWLFDGVGHIVGVLQRATDAGTGFVFGFLGGGPPPFEVKNPAATFVLAFRALPLILVVGALSAVFTYWGILPALVRGFAWALERTMRVGGAVGLSTAANVFLGMVEAPMLVRPYLRAITRAELFAVMTAGMATIAGTVLVVYASLLAPVLPGAAKHLLVASILSAPAALVIAKLMLPDTAPPTPGRLEGAADYRSAMDAVVRGTSDALRVLIDISALLVVFVALVYLVNAGLALLPDVAGTPLSLERAFGWAMAPLMWLIGIPWPEALTAGALMGTKTALNEFVAYVQLSNLPADALSPHSRLILTYALCGFANFGSLGIMIGAFAAMVPERRQEVIALGGRAIVAGTLASCMTGAVIGLFPA